MGGTLILSDEVGWLPANWLFNHVLSLTVERLPESAVELKKILAEADTKITGYADLRRLDAASIKTLLAAVEGAYEFAVKHPEAFGDPEFYPGYIRHFADLVAKLKADPRARS